MKVSHKIQSDLHSRLQENKTKAFMLQCRLVDFSNNLAHTQGLERRSFLLINNSD